MVPSWPMDLQGLASAPLRAFQDTRFWKDRTFIQSLRGPGPFACSGHRRDEVPEIWKVRHSCGLVIAPSNAPWEGWCRGLWSRPGLDQELELPTWRLCRSYSTSNKVQACVFQSESTLESRRPSATSGTKLQCSFFEARAELNRLERWFPRGSC